MIYILLPYVLAFVGGAVVWHFYATKVLGYATQVEDKIKAKL